MNGELLIVACVAGVLAGQINRGIYGLAWNRRWLSPWLAVPPEVPPRTWADRVPIWGWWRLRREAPRHGPLFWVRPVLIELAFVAGMVWLYRFVLDGGLLPIGAARPPRSELIAQFVNLAVLIGLMVIATFIDLDEKTIPDEVTVPGTWFALLSAMLVPAGRPQAWTPGPAPISLRPLLFSEPESWPAWLDDPAGLAIACFCVVAWWYALLPKTLWYRSGWLRFVRYLIASIRRSRLSLWLSLMALLAGGLTVFTWSQGGDRWAALLTAWMGLAIGGGVVWAVRVVGSVALGQEAMGFGDVTLLAMIGAFLGWQAALLVFFLAPFTGVLIALTQWVLTGRKDIAYGPFLCLATLVVVLAWPVAWAEWALPVFSLGMLLPIVLAVSLLLLGVLLLLVQWMRRV